MLPIGCCGHSTCTCYIHALQTSTLPYICDVFIGNEAFLKRTRLRQCHVQLRPCVAPLLGLPRSTALASCLSKYAASSKVGGFATLRDAFYLPASSLVVLATFHLAPPCQRADDVRHGEMTGRCTRAARHCLHFTWSEG